MAWRLHDTIVLKVASISLDSTPSIFFPTGNYHGFSQDWFDKFLEIRNRVGHRIEARTEDDGSYLIYLPDLYHFLENPHKDLSGLQDHLKALIKYLDGFNEEEKDNCVLLVQFVD